MYSTRMKIKNISIALIGLLIPLGTWAQTSPYVGSKVTSGDFFLYNVETGYFLQNNNRQTEHWNTRAELDVQGFEFEISANNNGWRINPKTGGNHSLNASNFYMDTSDDVTTWIFEPKTVNGVSNAYTIKSGNVILGASNNNLLLNSSQNSTWQLVSASERLNVFKTNSQNITQDSPEDITWMIPGANFNIYDERSEALNKSFPFDASVQLASVQTMANAVKEIWSNFGAYDIGYRLTNLPNGLYRFTFSGFYRDGSANNIGSKYRAGTETIRPRLYFNGINRPVKSICASGRSSSGYGCDFNTDGIYVPNSLAQAAIATREGLYINNPITVMVTDGIVDLGIQATNGVVDDWLILDYFKLEYLGSEDTPTNVVPVSISSQGNGQVTAGTSTIRKETREFNLLEGSDLNLVITPDNGCVLSKIVVNGSDMTSLVKNGELTLSNIVSNVSVNVTFVMGEIMSLTPGQDISNLIKNADCSSLDGWIYWGEDENRTWQIQGAHYQNQSGSAYLDNFIERWVPYNNNKLSDGALYQTIRSLPNGVYHISADIIACQQSSNSTGKEKGTYLYAYSGTNRDSTSVITNNSVPEQFSLKTKVTDNTLTFGIKTINSEMNWVAVDNWKLVYLGNGNDPISIKSVAEREVNVEAVTSDQYPLVGKNESLESIDDSTPLITDAKSQLYGNNGELNPCTDAGEGSVWALLGETPPVGIQNSQDFWHSNWHDGKQPVGSHYLQVKMPESAANLTKVAFKFTRRYMDNDQTVVWSVRGTNNYGATKENCELLATISTPFTSGGETLTSDTFNPKGYKYLRFYSEEQQGNSYQNRGYFHLARFQLYPVVENELTPQYYQVNMSEVKQLIGTGYPVLYAKTDGSDDGYTASYTCDPNPGFWMNGQGYVTTWDNSDSRWGVCYGTNNETYTSPTFFFYQYPDRCKNGDIYKGDIYLVNEETGKCITYHITLTFKETALEIQSVAERNVAIEAVTSDQYPIEQSYRVDMNEVKQLIGTDSPTLYAKTIVTSSDGSNIIYTKDYTYNPHPGFWLNNKGYVSTWDSTDSRWGIGFGTKDENGKVIYESPTFFFSRYPERCNAGYVFKGDVFLVNEETGKCITYHITLTFVEPKLAIQSVAERAVEIEPLTSDDYPIGQSYKVDMNEVKQLIDTYNPVLYAKTIITSSYGSSIIYTSDYTCKPNPGFWMNNKGFATLHDNSESRWSICYGTKDENGNVIYDSPTFFFFQHPNHCKGGDAFKGNVYLVNEETGKCITYQISLTIKAKNYPKPTFTREGRKLSILSAEEGLEIRYTIYDHSNPNGKTFVYGEPIILTHNCTIEAFIVDKGVRSSEIATFVVDDFQTKNPSFSLSNNILTIVCEQEGAVIYYEKGMTNEPTLNSSVYSSPIGLGNERYVRAFAIAPDFTKSEIVTFDKQAQTCKDVEIAYNGKVITITSPDEGARIYYTIGESAPTEKSTLYTGPITLKGISTINAIAAKNGYNNSSVTSYFTPCFFDGTKAVLSEGGSLQKAIEWTQADLLESIVIEGVMNSNDFQTIKTKMSSLRHLQMQDVSINELPENAFTGMTSLVSVSMPRVAAEGKALFKGCTSLSALIWNASAPIPASMLTEDLNPNLLLYAQMGLWADNVPGRFRNRIYNGIAREITLTDEGNFYCPQSFLAENISYTHTYSQKTTLGKCQGWETIALPFTVQTIRHEDYSKGVLSPFANNDASASPFWLGQMLESGKKFENADTIRAYTPYIISMPNNEDYADRYNLVGEVTFSAQDVVVNPNTAHKVKRGNITFIPAFEPIPQTSNILAINRDKEISSKAQGSVFRSYREVKPFEAYIEVDEAAGIKQFSISEEDLTGIQELSGMESSDNIYDLSGRKMGRPLSLKSGVYIKNGKKVLIK